MNTNIRYYNFFINNLNKSFNSPTIQIYNLLNYDKYGNKGINFIRLKKIETIEWKYIYR